MAEKGVVNIRGKEYLTVAHRVNKFREVFKPDDGWSIRTWLIYNEGDRVIIQASICDKDDHVVATGFAEEVRGSTKINTTSALENCETSAIGRALAAFGLGGEEYCSADELLNALAQQEQMEKEPQPEPTPKPEPKTKKPGPKAEERIEKYLTKISDIIGREETEQRWTNYLTHSEHANGNLSLKSLLSDREVTFSALWAISDGVKEMYESIKKAEEE